MLGNRNAQAGAKPNVSLAQTVFVDVKFCELRQAKSERVFNTRIPKLSIRA
jgi:hypothetical protein